ncbi:MAG TPA: hypothetical protein EYH45_01320 [Candidatus Caldiarchaeum subterraneum]|uniref:Uncharacterized protein n=1 Tax=Caldiarchaeum subterraneum TaxID=311458 RepID=A0A832ZUG0_CALS0|nr:hypothetical protein [Candidatus Caldarchaeum subterraneum]
MWTGMFAAGLIILIFGLFLDFVLLPFGFAFTVAGIIIMVLSFFLKPAETPEPSKPGHKFCWFCLNEIPVDAERCPVCLMRQK